MQVAAKAQGRAGASRQTSTRPAFGSVQARPTLHLARPQPCGRGNAVVVRADSSRADSNFWSGFVVGGVICGALGFVFAPQISKALLGDDSRIKLPRFLEDEQPKDPEQTKQDLIEKIAQLNASIDDVAAQLKVKEAGEPMKVDATA